MIECKGAGQPWKANYPDTDSKACPECLGYWVAAGTSGDTVLTHVPCLDATDIFHRIGRLEAQVHQVLDQFEGLKRAVADARPQPLVTCRRWLASLIVGGAGGLARIVRGSHE